jgi:hypothetical protein
MFINDDSWGGFIFRSILLCGTVCSAFHSGKREAYQEINDKNNKDEIANLRQKLKEANALNALRRFNQ